MPQNPKAKAFVGTSAIYSSHIPYRIPAQPSHIPSKPTVIYLENGYNDACLAYPTGPLWALNEVIHVKVFVSGFKYRG